MERIKHALQRARAERIVSKQIPSDDSSTFFAEKMLDEESSQASDVEYKNTKKIELNRNRLIDHRVMLDPSFGPAVSAYNVLRTQVLQRMRANNWTTLGVTGARKGAGKTLTAINLAISLAREVNQTVLLADLDLRQPSLAGHLVEGQIPGISDYLLGKNTISEILFHPGVERLVVLPGSHPLDKSSEHLTSPKMIKLVEELKTRYPDRLVLFDLPPLLIGDDVMAFSPNLDALIFVIEEGRTTRDELRRAYDLLNGERVIGTVLNKANVSMVSHDYG